MTTMRILPAWILLACVVTRAGATVLVGDSPTLNAVAIDGTPVDLDKLKGKLVLVDFWAGRSDLSKNYERQLLQIHRDYKDQGLEMIGICCDRKLEWAQKYIADLQIPWPQVHEPQDLRGGLGKEWAPPRYNWDFLISPGGKVIWVGEASKVRDAIESALMKHPPRLVEPDVLERANRELDAVEKLLTAKQREAAVLRFALVGDAAMKDRPYARRVRALRAQIDATTDALLNEVEELVTAQQYSAAAARVRELAPALSALPAGSEPRRRLVELQGHKDVRREIELADRGEKARAALAAARTVRDGGDDEAAYAKFRAVAQDYSDTPAGREAANAVKAYEADEPFMRRVRDHAVEAKAKAALSLAENYKAAGQKDKAKRKYDEIAKDFPGTTFADTARRELDKLP